MMTRKHYIEFARMFSEMKTASTEYKHIDSETIGILQVETARIFEADNPRFDHSRFESACNPLEN